MATQHSHYNILIIGAGIAGLAAAHTFLTLNPSLTLLIIDSKATVGGTWAAEQIYANLRACNLQGFFEYSDFPMLEAGLGVKPRGLLTGKVIHAYLEKFAATFGLAEHTRLNTKVLKATNNDGDETRAWTVEVEAADGGPTTLTCGKLLVCTGQTSQPKSPEHKGTEMFGGPIVHSVKLATEGEKIRTDPEVKRVTVIGAVKSAHDAVYNYATAGKQVTWLIRKHTGSRKAWMATSYPAIGPMRPWLEGLLMTRPLSWMGAAPWSTGDGFGSVRWFLHNTTVGRFIVRRYFGQMSADTVAQNGLLTLGQVESKALIPDATLQWYGGQAAVINYEKPFYQVVREKGVEIMQEQVEHLELGTIVLQDGRRVETDAIINATGYQFGPSFPILPADKQVAWGVPVAPGQDTIFPALDDKADKELFERFPELQNSPTAPVKEPSLTPWRLWRFIAPPSQVARGPRNLAFLTNAETYQNVLKAELVALWTYAYLNDELAVDPGSEEDVRYDAALWSRFGWWQKPLGKQGKTGDMLHEGMAYYDRLLMDLGLNTWRRGWGLLGEVFGGHYEVKEYTGLKDEWVAGNAGRRANGAKL